MKEKQELDIIAQIRSEIMGRQEVTGENLFLAWGYPTAIVLFLEFLALKLWNEDWCTWLWLAIPLVGAPLMVYFLRKDYRRTGRKTHEEHCILQMWLFIGFVSAIGATAMGFAGVFPMLYGTFQGLLIGFGCYMTGLIGGFRPNTVCGIIGTVASFLSLFFQGDQWPWQLFIAAVVAVIVLIVPGHMFRHYVQSLNAKP